MFLGIGRSSLLIAITSVALTAASPSVSQESSAPIRPAKLIDIVAVDPVINLKLPTIIEPSITADLTMLVGGTLNSLPVIAGQTVAKGDLIAQLDTATLKNTLAQAQAQYENAQIEFKRAETLVAQKAIAQTVFDERKSTRDQALLTVEEAKTQLGHATLFAPFDGIISQVNVAQFQTISSSTAVVTIQNVSNFEAVVNVPAQMIASSASIKAEDTLIILDVAPLISIPVTFNKIAPEADPASQTYEIKYSFQVPDGLIVLGGMTGELHAKLRRTGDAAKVLTIRVPVSAILHDGTDTYVWKVDAATMKVSKTKVTLADSIGEEIIVASGIGAGDTIVGAGASYLHDGMTIRRFED